MQQLVRILPAIVCALVMSSLATEAAAPRPAWVIPSVLNVRESRGTSAPNVGSLSRGTKVYVTAFNDGWCRISYDGGKRGWVAEWLLQFSAEAGRKLAGEAAKTAVRNPVSPPAWVKASGARVRSGAGTSYRHITSLERGAKLHIIGQSGSWRKVKLASGAVGWVRGDLLETTVSRGQQLAAAPPAATPESRPPKAFVSDDSVNVRMGPGAGHERVGQLDRGTTVWVIDSRGEWRKVKYGDGNGGWVAEHLLKYAEPSSGAGEAMVKLPAAAETSPPAVSEPPLESMYGWVAEETARLRYGPGMQFDVKKQVPEGTKVTVLDVEGHWCKVRVGPQEYGWIAAWCVDFLGPGNRVFAEESGDAVQVHVGWATGSGASLRSGPGTEHGRLATVGRGTEVVILDQSGDWYQVALSDNKVGWMSASLITTREEALARGEVPSKPARAVHAAQRRPVPGSLATAVASDIDTFGGKLATAALRYLQQSIRYVWGGSDPSRGFDCSGFVHHVLSTFGYRLPHNAAAQFAYGTAVSGMLRPGDLVFFRNTGRQGISHVGIYIGGGQFVHSSSARGGMVVSTLRSGYYAHTYAGARRIQ